ncbi:beta-Ig-H3/fasciclin [Streptomyces sp. NPDC017890]|uniref:beta-Ig-H3/fasciclin n=1 Tax=Streptomyces sp. NPDC017890 TaxID=3365015 RepID=UPI0037B6F257
MRLIKRLATAVAVTATASVAFAAPASAAPATATGTAPSCVKRPVHYNQDGFVVQLINTCASTKRVRVIVDWAPDSACYTLSPGEEAWYRYEGLTGFYDSTATC